MLHNPFMCDIIHSCVTYSFIPYMHPYCRNQKAAQEHFFSRFILFCSKTHNCMPACIHLSSFLWKKKKDGCKQACSCLLAKKSHPKKKSLHPSLLDDVFLQSFIHFSSFCVTFFLDTGYGWKGYGPAWKRHHALHLICALYAIKRDVYPMKRGELPIQWALQSRRIRRIHLCEPSPSYHACCSVLLCVAVCCSVLQCVAVCCSVVQCGAAWCSVSQCVAVCCSVLQCVFQSVFQCMLIHLRRLVGFMWVPMRCNVLQYVAVCCSVCCSVRCSTWEVSLVSRVL